MCWDTRSVPYPQYLFCNSEIKKMLLKESESQASLRQTSY